MALGSTQHLTEMSIRDISWGQRRPVHRAVNLATFMCQCVKIWEAQPPGNLRACNGIALTFSLAMGQAICNVQYRWCS
jgi:hypothetical protein